MIGDAQRGRVSEGLLAYWQPLKVVRQRNATLTALARGCIDQGANNLGRRGTERRGACVRKEGLRSVVSGFRFAASVSDVARTSNFVAVFSLSAADE